MGKLVLPLMVILAILHQDFWLWDDKTLYLGFLPSGLAYHIIYSIATALFGWFAIKYAWPHEVEEMAESASESGGEA